MSPEQAALEAKAEETEKKPEAVPEERTSEQIAEEAAKREEFEGRKAASEAEAQKQADELLARIKNGEMPQVASPEKPKIDELTVMEAMNYVRDKQPVEGLKRLMKKGHSFEEVRATLRELRSDTITALGEGNGEDALAQSFEDYIADVGNLDRAEEVKAELDALGVPEGYQRSIANRSVEQVKKGPYAAMTTRLEAAYKLQG